MATQMTNSANSEITSYLKESEKTSLEVRSRNLRRMILEYGFKGGEGVHLGGALSCIDILNVLYSEILCVDLQRLNVSDRDIFIDRKSVV